MKILKISLVLLLSLIISAVSNFNSVGAVDTEITWTMNTDATEHHLEGVYEFGTGIEEIIIHMPDDIDYILDNDNEVFTIIFYNSLDVIMTTLDGETVFGDLLTSQEYSYQLNFDVLGISTTAVKMKFILPQTYTDSNTADVGYIDYVNDNTTVSVNSIGIPTGLMRFYWEESPTGEANYLQGNMTPISYGTEYLGFRYTFSVHKRLFDEDGLIYFYDENDILLDTVTMNEYAVTGYGDPMNAYGSIDIPLYEITNYEDITQFRVRAIVWQYTPAVLYIYNNSFIYIEDGNVNTVNYYSEGEIVYSHLAVLGSIARYPITYPIKEGEIFSHWITANGVEYNFTAIDEDMLIGTTVNFYAVFEDIPDIIDLTVIDPTADEGGLFTGALTSMGFNDPIERTIVFGFVAVITAGLMLWKGISIMATIVVVGCELFFFMYLGLLPAFVSIIIILLLIFVGWGYRKGAES